MPTLKHFIAGRYVNQPAIAGVGSVLNVPLGSVVIDDPVSVDWLVKYATMARDGYQGLLLDRESPVPEKDIDVVKWAADRLRPLGLRMDWYQPFTLPEFGIIGRLRDDSPAKYAALKDRMKALARALPRDVGVAPSLYRTGIDDQVDRLARHVQTWRIVRDCFVDDRIMPVACRRKSLPDTKYVDCPPKPLWEFRSDLDLGFGLYGRVCSFQAAPDTDIPYETAKVSDPYLRVFLEVAGVQA